jgi:hypothetical protein
MTGNGGQGIALAGIGLLLAWFGLRKYQKDPEGKTSAAAIP